VPDESALTWQQGLTVLSGCRRAVRD